MMTSASATTKATRNRWYQIALVGVALVTVFMLLYRLDSYPAPWYDEGSHLHVAKNFALYGVYADSSSEGYRPFGPAIGVGPTVLLPIAFAFKLFGVGIPLARLVIVLYALGAVVAFYGLARLFLREWFALAALVLMLLSPGVDFFFHARTVLGEIPGLFFLTAALWLWLRPGVRGIPALLGVGVLMGLASITKNQFAMFILPSLLLAWITDLVWYRQRGWKHFVIPGVVAGVLFGAWLAFVVLKLGGGDTLAENLATLKVASSGAFLILKPATIERALRFLVDASVYGALALGFIGHGIFLSLPRTDNGQRSGTLMIFISIGLAFFVASLGWPRYAFGPLVLLAIVGLRAAQDLVGELPRMDALFTEGRATGKAKWALVLGWALPALIFPIYTNISNLRSGGDNASYSVAAWVDANVPQGALIETWEQDLGVLSNANFHYPPQISLAHAVAHTWEGGAPAADQYDFREFNPDYVIVGPFGIYTSMYPEDRLSDYNLIETIGSYQIYGHNTP
jgi:4-amino-4-deoxy-L-arabinose transferase-like glycosyltransferase